MTIDALKLEEIFTDCLFNDGEDTHNHIPVEGITNNFGLHPDRLQSHKGEIEEMLEELPDKFKASGGGGWSFLNACMDKHGNQWTSFHRTMEKLFVLGMGVGRVHCLFPKDHWVLLFGGMPYYRID